MSKRKKLTKTTASSEEGEIRVQVPLHPDAVERIDQLAERMKVGRGRMAAMLLEEGIEDNDWVIRMVTSGFMKPVRDLANSWGKNKKTDGSKESDR